MSAVATAEAVLEGDAPHVHLVTPAWNSTYEMHAAEQKRWMVYFGIPALIASIFLGTSFGTGDAWWIGLAIGAIIVDIFVLVWLAMSSDTNGVLGEPSHAGH